MNTIVTSPYVSLRYTLLFFSLLLQTLQTILVLPDLPNEILKFFFFPLCVVHTLRSVQLQQFFLDVLSRFFPLDGLATWASKIALHFRQSLINRKQSLLKVRALGALISDK